MKRTATSTTERPPANGTSEHQSLSKYIQARFDELALPLDPTGECHVRADRPALEYRRVLARLIERAG